MLTNLMFDRPAAIDIYVACTKVQDPGKLGELDAVAHSFFQLPDSGTSVKLPMLGANMTRDKASGLFVVSLEGYLREIPRILIQFYEMLEAVQLVHKRCPLRLGYEDGYYEHDNGTSILVETYLPNGSSVFVQDVTVTAKSFAKASWADGLKAEEVQGWLKHAFGR